MRIVMQRSQTFCITSWIVAVRADRLIWDMHVGDFYEWFRGQPHWSTVMIKNMIVAVNVINFERTLFRLLWKIDQWKVRQTSEIAITRVYKELLILGLMTIISTRELIFRRCNQ